MRTGMEFEAVGISGTGTTISSTGTASAPTALPATSDGRNPKYVRVQAISGVGYIKFGGSGVAATTNDIAVNTNTDRVFKVAGYGGFFSWISDTGTTKVNVTAVEA